MAAANADCVSGAHHAWSRRPAFVDRLTQRHVIKLSHCANVPDGRESCHQRVASVLHAENRRERFEVPEGRIFPGRIAQHTTDQVSMCIDESRQESYVAEI